MLIRFEAACAGLVCDKSVSVVASRQVVAINTSDLLVVGVADVVWVVVFEHLEQSLSRRRGVLVVVAVGCSCWLSLWSASAGIRLAISERPALKFK
jgi:hypothetical protein